MAHKIYLLSPSQRPGLATVLTSRQPVFSLRQNAPKGSDHKEQLPSLVSAHLSASQRIQQWVWPGSGSGPLEFEGSRLCDYHSDMIIPNSVLWKLRNKAALLPVGTVKQSCHERQGWCTLEGWDPLIPGHRVTNGF